LKLLRPLTANMLCDHKYKEEILIFTIQNHENENVRYIGQGEARHRKYKRLKLGGGHVYDRSSV
jgi:hypothetical protein